LDGYAASHRAVREMKTEGDLPYQAAVIEVVAGYALLWPLGISATLQPPQET
jgi:hypothetical protein